MESSFGIKGACGAYPCLGQLNQHAVDGSDFLKSFASDVAHEMRTPIGQIQSIAAMLLDQAVPLSDAEARRWIGLQLRIAKQMDSTVQGLLELAKVSACGTLPEEIDVSAECAELRETLLSDVPVLWEIEPCMRVHGYRPLVKVVLRNLLGNAVKYSQLTPVPRVEVSLERVGVRRFVRVRDNGAGFDMAAATRLFQPFSRLHDPAQFAGVGLGLCIVKRIVDFHGGSIAARSEPGAGACFEFSLESTAADGQPVAAAVRP